MIVQTTNQVVDIGKLKTHISTLEVDEPKSVKEALHGLDYEKLMVTMQEELDSLYINEVWDSVDIPQDRKAVGNKWVIKIKRKVDGTIERYKAWLVVKERVYKRRGC